MSNFFSQLNGFNEKAINSLNSKEIETEEFESFDYSEVDYTNSTEHSIFGNGYNFDFNDSVYESENESNFAFEA